MTRILVIEPSGNLWGSERALLDLLDNLTGVDPAICCPPGRPLQPALDKRGLRVFPTYIYNLHKKTKWHRLWAAFGVLQACLWWRPQVIYLNQAGSFGTVVPAAMLLNIPVVAHVRIFEDIAYLASQTGGRGRLRGVIAISHAVNDAIEQNTVLRTVPRHMLYDAYALVSSVSDDLPSGASAVACVGRVVPVKGQDLLVDAINLLAAEGRELECLMAGDGDAAYLARLRAASPPSIAWLGNASDVRAVLSRCALAACPSRSEPLGRVIFEAWDAGAVPIACAASGGAAEVIAASGGGLLYAEHSAEALAGALKKGLALTHAERETMVRKGRGWVRDRCEPRHYGRAVSAILQSAVDA